MNTVVTNYNHYFDTLLDLAKHGKSFGVDRKTHEMKACDNNFKCTNCLFYNTCGTGSSCADCREDWLKEEYQPIPLTTIQLYALPDEVIQKVRNYPCCKESNCETCVYRDEDRCVTIKILEEFYRDGYIAKGDKLV